MKNPPGKDILLIEDDDGTRTDLAELLEEQGYAVTAVVHGKEALDRLASGFRPRIILLDLMMPVMNGWEFRAELLKDPSLAAIPVVLLSGAGDLAQTAAALSAIGYCKKPLQLPRLLELIEQYC